jgi:hypothetical protein
VKIIKSNPEDIRKLLHSQRGSTQRGKLLRYTHLDEMPEFPKKYKTIEFGDL